MKYVKAEKDECNSKSVQAQMNGLDEMMEVKRKAKRRMLAKLRENLNHH